MWTDTSIWRKRHSPGGGSGSGADIPAEVPAGLTLLKVADTRAAMEIITPYFYDYPGKHHADDRCYRYQREDHQYQHHAADSAKAGHKVGLIGTINIMINDESIVSHNTTPDVVDLQKFLYRMQRWLRLRGHGSFFPRPGPE
jgi:hypothetical protein